MVLCDTHILIWKATDDPKLSRRLRSLLDSPDICAFSAVSLWEVSLLLEKGKILLQQSDRAEDLLGDLRRNGLTELPLTSEIAILSRTLPFPHEDPADRFLAATAFHHGIPLATQDERLHGISWLKTLS